MQISSINFVNNKIKNNKVSTSFSGSGIDGTKMRKAFYGITCPCCGIKMLNAHDISKAMRFPANASARDVMPVLDSYKNQLHHVERDVYYTLKALSIDNPHLNLRELLNLEREYHLDLLCNDENIVINRIRQAGQYLSPKSYQKLDEKLKEGEKFINQPSLDATFKRRAFIGKLTDTTKHFPEKKLAKTIYHISKELPRAENNKSAFIVKYTEKKASTGEEMNSHDIILAMLLPSLGTIEHVKVRSDKFKYGGGRNQSDNYILECQRDNNNRGSMQFSEFIKSNPRFFGKHMQNYIDTIISKLNLGELKGFENYPRDIAKTLKQQSKGLVNIDISKLNIPKDKNSHLHENF